MDAAKCAAPFNLIVMTIRNIKEILIFRGALPRKEYFYLSVSLLAILYVVHYMIRKIVHMSEIEAVNAITINAFLALLYLGIFMPLIVARLKDINLPILLSSIFWLSAIFDLRNIILLEVRWGIVIDFDSLIIGFIHICALILTLILFFKPGSHNKKFNMDSGADAPPPVN